MSSKNTLLTPVSLVAAAAAACVFVMLACAVLVSPSYASSGEDAPVMESAIATVAVGSTSNVVALVSSSDYKWESDDLSIVRVKSQSYDAAAGISTAAITGVKVGSAHITVSNGIYSASCTVTVTAQKAAATSVTKLGVTYSVSGKVAKVTKVKKSLKSCTIAKTVKIGGKTYAVSAIAAKVFKGTKVTKVTVKSTSLTKSKVKNCFKNSSVKAVKVAVSSKKSVNKKYLSKYKKVFTKAVCGKKVAVA